MPEQSSTHELVFSDRIGYYDPLSGNAPLDEPIESNVYYGMSMDYSTGNIVLEGVESEGSLAALELALSVLQTMALSYGEALWEKNAPDNFLSLKFMMWFMMQI